MAQWVLVSTGKVVPRRTVWPLRIAETHNVCEEKRREIFDKIIMKRLGSSYLKDSKSKSKVKEPGEFTAYIDEDEVARDLPEMKDAVDSTGELINQQPMYDKMLNSEVSMQLNNMMSTSKVARLSLGPDRRTTGSYNNNPILNTVVYDVESPDGSSREYSTNVIAENMISQVDEDGF